MTRHEVRGLKAYHRENFRLVPFKERILSREVKNAVAIAVKAKQAMPWIRTDRLVYDALASGMAYKFK